METKLLNTVEKSMPMTTYLNDDSQFNTGLDNTIEQDFNITILVENRTVNHTNLSLSKLTQQKIKSIMASYVDITQSISVGDLVEFCVNGDCKRGLIVKIENRFTGDEHIGYKYYISVVGSIVPKVVNYDIGEQIFFNVQNDDSIRITVLF